MPRKPKGNEGELAPKANEAAPNTEASEAVSYTHLRAHETVLDLVCRLLLEKKKHNKSIYLMHYEEKI